MITVESVSIYGSSDQGDFRGDISFDKGLNLICGNNTMGKSLIPSAIAWCLGIESIFGIQTSDNNLFSDAVKTSLWLDDPSQEAEVKKSFAKVAFLNQFESTLILERAITGNNKNLIKFCDSHSKTERYFKVGHGSMSDSSSGFHFNFFRWTGLPTYHLKTKMGRTAPIYLENLASLFFIQQTGGWNDIQSQQVHKYGLLDIRAASFEYLLGLGKKLKSRLSEQDTETEKSTLVSQAKAIIEKSNLVIGKLNSAKIFPKRKGLNNYSKFFHSFSFGQHVDHIREATVASDIQRITGEIERIQGEMNAMALEKSNRNVPQDISQSVIELKREIHQKTQELSSLRNQQQSHISMINSVEFKISTAKDLLSLLRSNIGVPSKVECPTCNRDVAPEDFDIINHNYDDLETEVEVFNAQRDALKKALELNLNQMSQISIYLDSKQKKLRQEQRELSLVNNAVSPVNEGLMKIAGDILSWERELDGLRDLETETQNIDQLADEWNENYDHFQDNTFDGRDDIYYSRIRNFKGVFFDTLKSLKHGIFKNRVLPKQIELDENYEPLLLGRPIRFLGSASDRARLIMAYAISIHQISLKSKSSHPGFLLFDEPLQQNPDGVHRSCFVDFLKENWQGIKGQSIIVTHLSKTELTELDEASVTYKHLTEKYFFKEGLILG